MSVLRESGFATGGPIVSSLPPISSERPYEEDDLGSLEDGGVPRAVRASRAFAASGASLASAVTDGFTVDDASTKSERDESTAQGEDGGDVSVDGSDSSKFSFDGCFCAYNASVGSYLLFATVSTWSLLTLSPISSLCSLLHFLPSLTVHSCPDL